MARLEGGKRGGEDKKRGEGERGEGGVDRNKVRGGREGKRKKRR
jgi:hypothetical protein